MTQNRRSGEIMTATTANNRYSCSRPLHRVAVLRYAALLACLPLTDLAAETSKDQPVMMSVYVDNDLFTGNNKDEDYTGGMAVTFSGADASSHPFSIDKSLTWINKSSGIYHLIGANDSPSDFTFNSCEVGLAAFTPTDIETRQPITNDRPYSSLIYLSNTQQSIAADESSALITSFTVGILGLPIAGYIQNAIHSVIGSNQAEGWDHQISEGGEPTFKYSATLQHYLNTGLDQVQATASAGMSLGYLTEASLGFSVRTGIIRSPRWSFNVHNSNYGEKSNIAAPSTQALDEFYLLAGANIKARAYNAFLQGQFRDSAVTYSSNEVEPLVYEGWLGLGCEFKSGIRLSYVVRHQSSELKSGLADRSFTYAEFIASYKY